MVTAIKDRPIQDLQVLAPQSHIDSRSLIRPELASGVLEKSGAPDSTCTPDEVLAPGHQTSRVELG